MSPRKPKRRPFRAWGKPMEFGKWKPEPIHEHDLVEVELPVGAQTLIIDKCQTPGCTYEAGRDLKGGNNDAK